MHNYINNLLKEEEEEELNYLENNIDPIQPKRKIFNKAHSVFISEKDHKSISQNLNGRKTIATSNVSSKTFEEEKLNHHMQNTRNYKEEENDSSQEREGNSFYSKNKYFFLVTN